MNPPTVIRIDFVSDVSCPWCAVGLHALEAALARVAPGIQAEIHLHPFELNPQMLPEGEDTIEHLTRKYGRSADEVRARERQVSELGIHSVPAVILNQRWLISGGQPVEVFERSLREAAAAPHQEPNPEPTPAG